MKNGLPSARVEDVPQVALADRVGCSARTNGARLVVGQRTELQPRDRRQPHPLGERRAQRVAAVQVVAAVGREDRDRGA